MSDTPLNETEKFILKEFYEGKSFSSLVRDFLLIHDVSRKKAEKIIYDCLYNFALTF